MALALEGERVMLVDFDLRHPTLHDEFQLPNTSGIADLLGATSGALPHEEPQHEAAHLAAAGRKSAGNPIGSLLTAIPGVGNRYIHDTALIGLRVVPSGQYEGQAARQLSAKRVRIALECLKADKPSIILFDTPPLTEGAEAVILSQLLDSAVVVVEARRTPAHLVTSVASELDALRPTLLGAILNKQ
jgi:Mrp family chromosome partitioning ATPase